MKHSTLSTLFFTLLIGFSFGGCSSSDEGSSDEENGGGNEQGIVPTNLVTSVDIQGQDADNPHGDGSGIFSGTITATDAVSYGFKVGSGTETENTTGVFSYTVNSSGTNQLVVTFYAYSIDEEKISKSEPLTVFVEGGTTGGSGNNDTLVWSDEFDGNGSINTSDWNYELGAGGWGNEEVQKYTSNSKNVFIQNGILNIKAIKETDGTYTSGRITTQNKIDFKYGRIDIRAKLPSVAGTWPALWMLGANYGPVNGLDGVGWPYCGEIDIMEQFVDKTYVKSTCHWNNNGSTASYGLPVDLATPTEFHVYSLEWNAGSIKALLDGVQFYSLSTSSAMPFDANFFFIFNLAMGGSNGGTIDPNFTSDSMEVDYVRVYQ